MQQNVAMFWPPQQQLNVVRDAINALSSGIDRVARPADAWLEANCNWRVCLKLLELPDVRPNESFFAANNIKTACLKHQDVLDVVTLSELLPQLAYHLQACLHRQQWAPSNQLASAIAALAARSPSMQADALLQVICSSFSHTTAQALAEAAAATATAATAAAEALAAAERAPPPDQQQQALGHWGYSGWHGNIGADANPSAAANAANVAAAASARTQEVLQLRFQQEPLVLAALLQVLATLPDILQSRQVLWYTFDRRQAVKSGLLTGHSTTLVIAAALCSQNSRLLMLSCDALSGLCELGAAPVGLEVQAGALQVLAGALLSSATCAKAADAVAALAAACKGCRLHSPKWQLLVQLVQQLQLLVFPALTAQHELLAAQGCAPSSTPVSEASTPMAASTATSVAGAAGPVVYTQAVGRQFSAAAEAVFCRMLCAFGSALLTPVLQGVEGPQEFLQELLQQLLLSCGADDDAVATTAISFFQEEYVGQLQAFPNEQLAAILVQQQPVVEALTAALVRRTQLTPVSLAAATADARDLPEEMRTLRREIAAAMRAVGGLIGRDKMLAYMVLQVKTYHQAVLRDGTGGEVAPGSDAVRTVPFSCCQLESAMYGANVVLGRLCDISSPEIDQLVTEVVKYGSHAATNYTHVHKLAGTALTLLGGLPLFLVRDSASLSLVLNSAITALRSPDDKLARNAATCVQRLTACEELAAMLFAAQPAAVQQLLQEYQRRGGLPVTLIPSVGDDQSTEELLLLGLCSIAVAHSSSSNSIADINTILAQLVGPQLHEASQELTAALQGNWPPQLPSVLEAPMPPQPQARAGPKWRRPTQPPRPQHPPPSSKAAVCFEAVAKLVAGLPTGVGRYTIGVPLHTRHQRHEVLLQQVCSTLGIDASQAGGQQQTGIAAGGDSAASSEASVATGSARAAGGAEVGASVLTALLHVGQGRQQPQHAVLRQQHACLFVAQLLVQASSAVSLSLRTAALAMAHPQTARFGTQLMAAVTNFLQSALPASLHYHMLTSPTDRGRSSSSSGSQGVGSGSGEAAAASVLPPAAVILQLCQQLEQLPVQLLQQAGCLQLLLTMITCASLAGALPEEECLSLEAMIQQQQQQQPPQPSQPPHLQQQRQQQQQLLMLLQRLVGAGLTAACQSIVEQQGAADEDFAAAALSLASVCLQRCPAVLVGVDMAALFSMTLVASKTYHLKQVTVLLDWVQVAVCGAYAQVQPVWDAGGGSPLVPAELSAAPAVGVGFGRSLLSAIRLRLETGMGPELVLALMMAASGAMPSDVVLPVSLCLHSIWLAVGPSLFQTWLQGAVQSAPETAPWARVRHVLKVQFFQNLTERSCVTDTTKFKGILKSFCGGKRKVPGSY